MSKRPRIFLFFLYLSIEMQFVVSLYVCCSVAFFYNFQFLKQLRLPVSSFFIQKLKFCFLGGCNAITPALECVQYYYLSSSCISICIWVALLWRLIMTRLYCTYCSTRPVVNREPISLSLTMYTERQQFLSIHRPVLGKGVSEPQQSGKS